MEFSIFQNCNKNMMRLFKTYFDTPTSCEYIYSKVDKCMVQLVSIIEQVKQVTPSLHLPPSPSSRATKNQGRCKSIEGE